jgi:hypothetical protein
MEKSRFGEEQIIGFIKQAEAVRRITALAVLQRVALASAVACHPYEILFSKIRDVVAPVLKNN